MVILGCGKMQVNAQGEKFCRQSVESSDHARCWMELILQKMTEWKRQAARGGSLFHGLARVPFESTLANVGHAVGQVGQVYELLSNKQVPCKSI